MSWAQDVYDYKEAGFLDSQIEERGNKKRQELTEMGFKEEQIKEYFGVKEPDMTPMKEYFNQNFETAKAEKAAKAETATGKQPEVADTFIEAIEAGWGQSSGEMMKKALQGKSVKPEFVLPEDAPMYYRIASQVSTLAGDLPAMVLGAGVGTPAGATLGPVGAVVGGGAGGFAMPEAIRQTLMNYYEKGEIHDFQDFWERTSATFIETAKAAAIGGATAGIGGKVFQSVSKIAAPEIASLASAGSEVATMTTLGKALHEGGIPSAQDFIDGAVLVGGLKLATSAPAKLRSMYAKTGKKPADIVLEAQTNPILKQEILSVEKPAYETTLDTKEIKLGNQPKLPPISEAALTAQDKILSKIKSPEEIKKPGYSANDFYKDFVDRLDPLNRAAKELNNGKNPDTISDPYSLARMASDAPAKALHFLGIPKNPELGGVLDFKTLEKTGPSLQKIISPVKTDLKSLEAYIVSKRVIELENRGIKHGFDIEAAKEVVKSGKEKFDEVAKGTTEFANGGLKYLRDSGMITKQAYKRMVESEAYTPLRRILEDGEASARPGKKNPVKRISGSDADAQSPLLSLAENTEIYIKAAESNRAKVALIDLALKSEGQTLIEKVKAPMKGIEVTAEEANRALLKSGATTRESFIKDMKARGLKLTDEQINKALEKEQQNISAEAEAFTIFRPQDRPLAKDEFDVYRNGKREVYKTTPELAEAIKILDGNPTSQNVVLKVFRGLTTAKRLAITLTPDFVVRNFIRDQATANVFTQSGKINPFEVLVAVKDIVSKNERYFNYLKSGGANGAFIKLGDNYFKQNIYELNEATGFLDRTWNTVKKPAQFMEMVSTLAEQSTRLAEQTKVSKGESSGPELFKSGMAAREVTLDFQRVGAKIAAANSITAFMNASIQGLDRTARAIKTDPVGTTAKAAMYLTAPSLLLWYANHDDERYKELPQWQKDLFWIIPTDNWTEATSPGETQGLPPHLLRTNAQGRTEINKGVIYRIPKPQELGLIFATLPERVMDAFFTDNPDAFSDFGKTVGDLVTPAFMPDVVTPILEQSANHSFFTSNPLVPQHLEDQLPAYQYTPYTTESAKQLGKLVATASDSSTLASPMVIENYVRSWSGNMGMYALQLADKALQKVGIFDEKFEKPAWSVAEIPFVKAFTVKYPSAQAESIRRFYEEADENAKVLNTVKALMKQGDVQESEYLMKKYEANMQNLEGVKDALKNQGKFVQMIFKNPDITKDEKRQLIDGAYFGMIETAKMGRKMSQDFKKQIEEDKKGDQ